MTCAEKDDRGKCIRFLPTCNPGAPCLLEPPPKPKSGTITTEKLKKKQRSAVSKAKRRAAKKPLDETEEKIVDALEVGKPVNEQTLKNYERIGKLVNQGLPPNEIRAKFNINRKFDKQWEAVKEAQRFKLDKPLYVHLKADKSAYVISSKKPLEQSYNEIKPGGKAETAIYEKLETEKRPAPKSEAEKESPYLTDNPFTQKEMDLYNNYTHFPIDFNKEFKEKVQEKISKIQKELENYGIKEFPKNLVNDINDFRFALYSYYLTKFKAQSYAPPPSVVGPSKYPYHKIEKAEKWTNRAYELVKKADKMLERTAEGLYTTKIPLDVLKEYEKIALSTPRMEFGKIYYQHELDKHKNEHTNYAEVFAPECFLKLSEKMAGCCMSKL